MAIILKKIGSLLLVLILLVPSIAKIEHHHCYVDYQSKDEKEYHTDHGKCYICSFEFSLFSVYENPPLTAKPDYYQIQDSSNKQYYISNSLKYSFLLRAPPLLANTI